MSIIFKNGPEYKAAVVVIEDYSNRCPKCHSDNIANENDENSYTCHSCSNQFDDTDYMDKIHIVALLRINGLNAPANSIAEMSPLEFEDFLINNIY